ncbi:putative transcriptional regulator [Rhodopirellula rubra]|uniref:Putative transcriptional regulator n=1 Tax=Aporhodopirellula rubra TaxID=980271 RepID=A0A7W5DZG9_9BACT|nr:ASCH domain-containing protein [Aporhodopirellula rubra]MBB3207356.1 putative transcriptional regulator [Aporhodopirellula rubra]
MLFLSIHPEHVRSIAAGRKTVELRKRKPSIEPGSRVVIYATTPECEVVGVATIEAIHVETPTEIWRSHGKQASVTRQAFDAYYAEADKAIGIEIKGFESFAKPVSLRELRQRWAGFQPPQQYRYLDQKQQRFITERKKRSKRYVSA